MCIRDSVIGVRYDTRCYFNVRSKADISRLNLPHGAVKVGKPVCEVLPATHALTGCDITRKFGTKAAGINAEPVLYSKDFGRAHTDVQDCVQNAEKFLVQVLNIWNNDIEIMDRLRFN